MGHSNYMRGLSIRRFDPLVDVDDKLGRILDIAIR